MENTFTLENMVEQLGGTPPAEETPPVVDNPVDPTPVVDPAPAGTDPVTPVVEETPGTDPQQQQTNTEPPVDKSQQAFVHMRQQNKKYGDTIKGIASLLGIEGDLNNEDNILAALQNKITEHEAEQHKVPVELYQRLQQLEQVNQEYTAQQKQQAVASGFETVKTQFKLTQEELNAFATDLVNAGRNPLETQMDLPTEYKSMYFDRLVQKRIDEAVAAEQARAVKAGTQSTTPANQNGNNPNPGDQKVSSVRELETWFNGQSR